ncbi:HAD-IA family hydrolase [Cognatiyoonia sp. IB215182]|uniref:HAD-IA family hydrolase n=1 Tax=Cognatiyoonia sp. IB215182 TaxID=3097353 RepID=UPI002A0CBE82|nr:HAD-IA family hydrolase [Cognatiyoonia sp. IB215182]MDX8354498.1 HAD-IA family hydrolase [Cognatiyoonia sp. IB215182]
MTRVAALVPLKLHSRRLPNKNFLRLGDHPLARHVFETLTGVETLNEVYCYCSKPQVMQLLPESVRFLARPERLDQDTVKANELFRYAVERISAEVIVLCHATAPFISRETVHACVEAVSTGRYDSAASVIKLRTYCWHRDEPLNYDPAAMAQTQDLAPVYAETSGVYVFRKADYLTTNTRINGRTFLADVDAREAVDIDYPEDFALAQALLDFDPRGTLKQSSEYFVGLMNSTARNRDIKLVTFDLDGVLIDSVPAMKVAWSAACEAAELSIPFERYAKGIGFPFREILRQLEIDDSLHATIEQVYNAAAIAAQDKIKTYPGVSHALARLQKAGVRVAVATSKNRERTTKILAELLPDIQFDHVTTPDDVKSGRGKPHPDQLMYCALEVGIDPQNTIYVGDMEVDKEASQRAGFRFVHAGWGYGTLENVNDVWFASMNDFVEFLLE